jgi:ABC-2 type transport system ATP-binding protein
MIRVENLVQHYSVRLILRGVSFEAHKGEILVIMGPNGMGKSTLLGAIGGVLAPQDGFVEIGGLRRRSSEDNELIIRRQTFYLPDQAWIPPMKTGREWALAVARLWEVNELRALEHLDHLLQVFGMDRVADSVVGSYSTGQKKKIGLVCAFLTEAPVLLLDEPFSGGLDPSGLLATKSILQYLAKEKGFTIIVATPVPELVEEIADRIMILKNGRIAALDSMAGLKATAGAETLEEAYEKLTNPQTLENLQTYMQSRPK